MPGFRSAAGAFPFLTLAAGLFLLGCPQRGETPQPPPAKVDSLPAPEAAPTPAAEPDTTAADTAAETIPAPEPVPPVHFASRPPPRAYVGIPLAYTPRLSRPGTFRLRLLKGPDSMTIIQGRVAWVPVQAGRFAVLLEAVYREGGDSLRVQQGFSLSAGPAFSLSLKPFPERLQKGDSLTFDLRGTGYPAWALPSLRVRFDYDGDGKWDTQALPLAFNLLHRQACARVGVFTPKVEVSYLEKQPAYAQGKISVISPVHAVLKLSPDTVEPGGELVVDASASKGDGALVYRLDLDGDGKWDWTDSSTGRATLRAPGAGLYQPVLLAVNGMGQEDKAMGRFRSNARPKIEVTVRNARDHMAAKVELLVKAWDPDDSLLKAKINFTGDSGAWEMQAPEASRDAHSLEMRRHHVYGKTGTFKAAVCVLAGDGRSACQIAAVEIFNAPPVCRPGPDLRATLGLPLEITGDGEDPDGKIVKWEWDLDGDGGYDLISRESGRFHYTFAREGVFSMQLRVTTADGKTATAPRKVEVRKKWKS